MAFLFFFAAKSEDSALRYWTIIKSRKFKKCPNKGRVTQSFATWKQRKSRPSKPKDCLYCRCHKVPFDEFALLSIVIRWIGVSMSCRYHRYAAVSIKCHWINHGSMSCCSRLPWTLSLRITAKCTMLLNAFPLECHDAAFFRHKFRELPCALLLAYTRVCDALFYRPNEIYRNPLDYSIYIQCTFNLAPPKFAFPPLPSLAFWLNIMIWWSFCGGILKIWQIIRSLSVTSRVRITRVGVGTFQSLAF